ncbi:MAG: hypothetical protein ACLP4V_03155 [Methylocella sp.]
MRALFGAGTPKEAAVIRNAFLFVIQTAEAITAMIAAVFDADGAALIIAVASDVALSNRDFFTGLLRQAPPASRGRRRRNMLMPVLSTRSRY